MPIRLTDVTAHEIAAKIKAFLDGKVYRFAIEIVGNPEGVRQDYTEQRLEGPDPIQVKIHYGYAQIIVNDTYGVWGISSLDKATFAFTPEAITMEFVNPNQEQVRWIVTTE